MWAPFALLLYQPFTLWDWLHKAPWVWVRGSMHRVTGSQQQKVGLLTFCRSRIASKFQIQLYSTWMCVRAVTTRTLWEELMVLSLRFGSIRAVTWLLYLSSASSTHLPFCLFQSSKHPDSYPGLIPRLAGSLDLIYAPSLADANLELLGAMPDFLAGHGGDRCFQEWNQARTQGAF